MDFTKTSTIIITVRHQLSTLNPKQRLNSKQHPDIENNDSSKPIKKLIYLDANNLYGCVMRYPLPIGFMRWLDESENNHFDVMKVSADSRVGYTLEVDLEYPSELHDDHNCYPLAPEHKILQDEELSKFGRR